MIGKHSIGHITITLTQSNKQNKTTRRINTSKQNPIQTSNRNEYQRGNSENPQKLKHTSEPSPTPAGGRRLEASRLSRGPRTCGHRVPEARSGAKSKPKGKETAREVSETPTRAKGEETLETRTTASTEETVESPGAPLTREDGGHWPGTPPLYCTVLDKKRPSKARREEQPRKRTTPTLTRNNSTSER